MTKIQKKLFEHQDEKYKAFQAPLIPDLPLEKIIGVRVPVLRALAKEIFSDEKNYRLEDFLASLPHKYLEENYLHSFIIEQIKAYEECMKRFKAFLPFIDNWAVCDTCHPEAFKKNADKVLALAGQWIKSPAVYTVRYGISVFMNYFLDENFKEEYLEKIAAVKSSEYYINMMQAWYFATALSKQWNSAVKIIEEKKLSVWVHNKTIQKARESFRVSEEHKNHLLGLKIKAKKEN